MLMNRIPLFILSVKKKTSLSHYYIAAFWIHEYDQKLLAQQHHQFYLGYLNVPKKKQFSIFFSCLIVQTFIIIIKKKKILVWILHHNNKVYRDPSRIIPKDKGLFCFSFIWIYFILLVLDSQSEIIYIQKNTVQWLHLNIQNILLYQQERSESWRFHFLNL